MKQNIRGTLIRVAILMIGLVIAHLGVTLFLLADLGADPFNVCVQGIFRQLQRIINHPLLTHGNVHICISLLIILILLAMDRSYVRIGTLLCMICGGPIIDGFSLLIQPVFAVNTGLPFRLCMVALGCVILAFGMTLVIRSEAGTGPNDLVAVVISDKTGKKFGVVRVIVDFTFIAIGAVAGGVLGVGTVVCAFLVGPVAGFFLPYSGKIVTQIIKKLC